MNQRDRVKLLSGPYHPPPLKRRDRAFCLFRDTDVVVTSWTDVRISWPKGRAISSPRGQPGLIVCDDLVRALHHESATAIVYWWGVCEITVTRWRKALGIGRKDPEGSRRLIQAACQAGADVNKIREFSEKERRVRRQNALKNNLAQYLHLGYHGPRWTKRQLALLGKLPDAEVAEQIGRSVNAVRIMRERRGIARLNP
jgi:hypothetical protein